jgi:hypothetical protein
MALPTRTMVAPSSDRRAMSPDMPIDSVSRCQAARAQAWASRRSRAKAARCSSGRSAVRESPSGRAGAGSAAPPPGAPASGSSAGRGAALAGLAADVHLQADVQRPSSGGRCSDRRWAIFRRSTVCTQSKLVGDRARLVALDRADEMPLQPAYPVARAPRRRSCRRLPADSFRRRRAGRRRSLRARLPQGRSSTRPAAGPLERGLGGLARGGLSLRQLASWRRLWT